jgi:hypothetical protein
MIIRRQVTVTFMQSKEIGNRNLNLKLTEGRALLFGTGILVLGIRVSTAYVMTWMEDGNLNEVWVGGNITMWAFAALIVAIIWQLLVKAAQFTRTPKSGRKSPIRSSRQWMRKKTANLTC